MNTAALAIVLALGAGACTGDTPSYCDDKTPCPAGQRCNLQRRLCEQAPTGDGGTDGDAADDGPRDGPQLDGPKKKVGQSCQVAAQCDSGFCADGVCCATACDQICRTCNANGNVGTCVLVLPNSDPRDECAGNDPTCGGSCDGAGACQFPSEQTSCGATSCAAGQRSQKKCDGAGACVADTQSCGGYACDSNNDCKSSCGAPSDCSGSAQCVGTQCVAQQPLGSPCGSNPLACASMMCTDGVCCGVADCGACKVCGSGGGCQNEADNKSCGALSCSGSTLTTPQCQSGACTNSTSSCGRYQCDGAGAACRTSCSQDTHCTSGNFCDGTSCVQKRADGAGCATPNQCQSGKCTDSVCCSVADCGSCKACAAGTGLCAALPDGAAPSGDCPGDPGCNPNQCKAGSCDYAVNALCAESCSGSTYTESRCSATGSCAAQTPASCTPYVCDAAGVKCRTSCVANAECVADSLCDVTSAETTGQGSCIDVAKVKPVSSSANLQVEVTNAMAGATITHLKLLDAIYAGFAVGGNGVITLVGTHSLGTEIRGNRTAGSNVIQINSPAAELRLQDLRITDGGVADPAGPPGSGGDGIQCLIGKLVVVDSAIERNETWGIRATSCSVTVRRTHIINNFYGGIYHRVDGRLIVSNSVIGDNDRCDDLVSCERIGVGVYTAFSGGISFVPLLENVVLFRNGNGLTTSPSGDGGGITCEVATTLRNAIVDDNDFTKSGVADISNIKGNCNVSYTTYSGGPTVPGTGNVKDSCGLVGTGAPSAGTSCINSGTSSTLAWDRLRTARLKGAGVDRGAYEVQ